MSMPLWSLTGISRVCTVVLLLLCSQGLVSPALGKEHGFALLAQNAIVNFGFEYQMNVGRLTLQDVYPVRSTIIQHVHPNITKSVILNLADQGYDMFMFAQTNLIEPVIEVAKARPDLYFGFIALWTPAQNMTNFKCFQMSAGYAFYMMGYLAGKLTKTNKIGYVGIYPGLGLSAPVVSFAFGMQDANPKAEMHMWDQNTTLEPLATQLGVRSARDLLARGCDMFITDSVRKDDQLLKDAQLTYTNTGWFGSTADLRAWIGDSAMTSGVFDWSTHISTFIGLVLNDTWSSAPFLYVGNLLNNKTPLMPLSPRVPADIAADYEQRKAEFMANPMAPFCGKRAAAVLKDGEKPALPGDCMSTLQYLTSIVKYPDFAKYYGIMKLPSIQIQLDTALQAGLYVVCGVAAAISVLMIVLVVLLRDRGVIHYAGWLFCILMCVGPIIIDAGAALLLPERSAATCTVQVWLSAIGASLLIGVMLARQFRLGVIHWGSQKLMKVPVKNVHVAIVAGVYVFINVVLLILFTVIDTPDVIVHESGDDPDLGEYEWRYVCKLSDVSVGFLIAIIVVNGIGLLAACVIAVYARGIRIQVFDEANWMSMGVFCTAFAGCMSLLGWFTASGFLAQTYVAYAGIMITGNIALLWIMVPKFYAILTKSDGSENYRDTDLRPTTGISGTSAKTSNTAGRASGSS